jgi:NADP-dependent 3-hydroxy acid dehydrogenase YdfG
MLDVNVAALMMPTRAALPHLLEAADREPRRVADLVNISSVVGRVARAGSAGVSATKSAVHAYSEARSTCHSMGCGPRSGKPVFTVCG